MATLKEIITYSKANPNTDYAKTAYLHIKNGDFDAQAQKEGVDLSFAGRPPLKKKESISEKIGDFTGGTKIAQGIGQAIAQPKVSKELEAEQAQSRDLQTKLLDLRKQKKAKGEDTAHLDKTLHDLGVDMSTLGNNTEKLLNPENLTKKAVIGDAVQLAANAIPGLSKGGLAESGLKKVAGKSIATTLAAKTALGAGTGYAMDVGNKLQDSKKTVGNAFVPGAGTVIGGALPIAGAGLSYIKNNLPSWLVKKALPKLDGKNVETALQKPIGSISTLHRNSQKAIVGYEDEVQKILRNKYAGKSGNAGTIVSDVQSQFANAELDEKKVVNIVKQVAKVNSKLVDKVAKGVATLEEQNTLRKELDRAVYPKFTDTPSLTFNKQLAKSFADLLRSNVQSTAKETKPIFADYAKEIDFNKALAAASKKIQKSAAVGLYDIASFFGGGIPGVIAEKTVRAPAAQLTAAKAISNIGKAAGKKIPKAIGSVAKRAATMGAAKITK